MPKKLKFLKQLTFVILTEDPENLLVLCLLLPLPQLGGHQLGKLLPFHLQDIRHPIKTFLPFHLKVTPFNENTPHFPHTGCAIQSEHSSHSTCSYAIQSEHSSHSTYRLRHPIRTLLVCLSPHVTPSNQKRCLFVSSCQLRHLIRTLFICLCSHVTPSNQKSLLVWLSSHVTLSNQKADSLAQLVCYAIQSNHS